MNKDLAKEDLPEEDLPEEDLPEEDSCCICLSVLYLPTQIVSCGHLFCRPCLEGVPNSKCPLCRTSFSRQGLLYLHQKATKLALAYPELTSKRQNERKVVLYRIKVGNVSEPLNSDPTKQRWNFYIEPAPGESDLFQVAQEVRVFIKPTFKPSQICFLGGEQILVSRVGRSEFPIVVRITWSARYGCKVSQLEHQLEFKPHVFRYVTLEVGTPQN